MDAEERARRRRDIVERSSAVPEGEWAWRVSQTSRDPVLAAGDRTVLGVSRRDVSYQDAVAAGIADPDQLPVVKLRDQRTGEPVGLRIAGTPVLFEPADTFEARRARAEEHALAAQVDAFRRDLTGAARTQWRLAVERDGALTHLVDCDPVSLPAAAVFLANAKSDIDWLLKENDQLREQVERQQT